MNKDKTKKKDSIFIDEFAYKTMKEHEKNIKEDSKCNCETQCEHCKCKGEQK